MGVARELCVCISECFIVFEVRTSLSLYELPLVYTCGTLGGGIILRLSGSHARSSSATAIGQQQRGFKLSLLYGDNSFGGERAPTCTESRTLGWCVCRRRGSTSAFVRTRGL